MADLTILFITASEMPEEWEKYHRSVLEEAAGEFPIISVSRKPLDLGLNLLDTEPKSLSNIYRQMLRAAKLATTPYVAMAESDTLYHKDHFRFYRPKDEFAYDQNRFALFTWGKPVFHWRNRLSNCSLIAPRDLLIEALEERFQKYPGGTPHALTGELGRKRLDSQLGLTERKCTEVFANVSLIQINHENASEERQKNRRKSYGPIRAYDIPHWGKAKDLIKKYK